MEVEGSAISYVRPTLQATRKKCSMCMHLVNWLFSQRHEERSIHQAAATIFTGVEFGLTVHYYRRPAEHYRRPADYYRRSVHHSTADLDLKHPHLISTVLRTLELALSRALFSCKL
ncbi:hypothetical protein JB92DRAFT_2934437 [Gautieria morchelliformis]|nr:hypothetical protein JB92DRAFT_2934437 [Gautieria morchelliformis]